MVLVCSDVIWVSKNISFYMFFSVLVLPWVHIGITYFSPWIYCSLTTPSKNRVKVSVFTATSEGRRSPAAFRFRGKRLFLLPPDWLRLLRRGRGLCVSARWHQSALQAAKGGEIFTITHCDCYTYTHTHTHSHIYTVSERNGTHRNGE